MTSGSLPPRDPSGDSSPDPAGPLQGGGDPYERLQVAADASFDEVQAARQARLNEAGDDPMARSRVEAAYDAVLMGRLKERQQGKVSSAARTASQREQAPPPPSRPALPALSNLPQLPAVSFRAPGPLPALTLASGRERWFPLLAHGVLLLLLLLVPGASPELLLALATLATVINLQRRRGRLLAAVGFSIALLVVGLLIGALLHGVLNSSLPLGLPLAPLQLESLPALVLLLLGALLIG